MTFPTLELEQAITALMTCAPVGCAHESECFRVARFAREQVRAAYAQLPGMAVPAAQDPDEVADYAPQWRGRRIG